MGEAATQLEMDRKNKHNEYLAQQRLATYFGQNFKAANDNDYPEGANDGNYPEGSQEADDRNAEQNQEVEDSQQKIRDNILQNASEFDEAGSFRARLLALQQMERNAKNLEDTKRDGLRDEVRTETMKIIRRGTESIAETIAGSLDLGTFGISTIVTIMVHAVSLTDLNLQMIWGYYLSGKKSVLFPPLQWAPLPIPLPDFVLHFFLCIVDIFILTLILIGFILLFILISAAIAITLGPIYIAIKYATDPAFRNLIETFANF